MEFILLVLVATYIGVGLYEFYKSFLFGQPTRECILNGLVWPVDVWFELSQLIKANYIDKEGP